MKHIFITTLKQSVESWLKAFPQLTTIADVVSADVAGASIIWVHAQIEQGQQWRKHVQQILTFLPSAKVIVLSNNPEQAEAMQALELGAVGYLHAYAHQHVLQEVYSVVSHGGVWLGRDVLKHLITLTTRGNPQPDATEEILEGLTKREREVALEAARGNSNKEIARTLSISERTVKAHLTSVFDTLKVRDRLHLALVLQGKSAQGHFSHDDNVQKDSLNKLHLNS
ncbi:MULTISPECIES: response regulator transcription factor [unclassified Methylophilus]|uniref:LuxR family transcriptional regulator n=1 Tax=unclassified Methylophilus TaxID=2630143 RepID=UPI000370CFB0|nr:MULTISPECIES: response regulator transcription factor [unclassified Methylophilus]HCU85349.1 DNA-binding response regulator [Methylophilus sp.]